MVLRVTSFEILLKGRLRVSKERATERRERVDPSETPRLRVMRTEESQQED